MTIFLTTQYLEEADKLADEVAIINRGRIATRGAPRDLKKEIGNEVVTAELRLYRTGGAGGRGFEGAGSQATDCEPRLVLLLRGGGRQASWADPGARRGPQIPLEALTLSEPTLDDVFLRATGHRLAGSEEEVS